MDNGYAKVEYLYGKYKYVEELKELETKAKKAKKGLWQKESSSSTTSKKSKNKNILENITDTLQSIVNLLSQISKVFKFR